MRAIDPSSLEEIKIDFYPDDFLGLHELVIKGNKTAKITRRGEELTMIYNNIGFKVLP